MSLREQMRSTELAPRIFGTPASPDREGEELALRVLKGRIHALLLDRIDLKAVEGLTQSEFRDELKRLIDALLSTEDVVINDWSAETWCAISSMKCAAWAHWNY